MHELPSGLYSVLWAPVTAVLLEVVAPFLAGVRCDGCGGGVVAW